MTSAPSTTPNDERPARGLRARWSGRDVALVAGGWALVGLLSVAQRYAASVAGDVPPPTLASTAWAMESMAVWALLTPLIFAFARRVPFERGRVGRALALHAGFAVVVHLLDVGVDGVLTGALDPSRPPLSVRVLVEGFVNVFSYVLVAGIAYAVQYAREAEERRVRAAELEGQLLQARLQALEMQIHPHFLFNTLNAVASLIRAREDKAAIAMLVGLGDLLRLALRNREAQEVPLREELEFVDRYLAVERIRFQDRLSAEVEVSPETPLDALVPHLVLQPLVENAIRHGVEARAAAGRVRVRVGRENGSLRLVVSDDGPGPGPP
ncbi:MAG TPA: histidine kinase, partial [Longimicrobium sp.]|nr:histidine kinase [Longimicrobium sp.]